MISSIFDVGHLEGIPLSIQFSSSLASRVTKEIDTSRPLIRYRPWAFRMMVLSSRICGSRSQICPISRSIISLERKPAKASYLREQLITSQRFDSAVICTNTASLPKNPARPRHHEASEKGSTDEENRCSPLQATLFRSHLPPIFWCHLPPASWSF